MTEALFVAAAVKTAEFAFVPRLFVVTIVATLLAGALLLAPALVLTKADAKGVTPW